MLQGVDKNGIKPYQFHPVKSPLQNEFIILRPCQPQGIGDILYLLQPWHKIQSPSQFFQRKAIHTQ